MAVDMFIKIGSIKGESKDSAHKDEIDVLAWSWGGSQSGTMHMGGGGGSGKAAFQDLSITKYVDLASPLLLEYLSLGKHIDNTVLEVRKAGGEQMPYLKLTLTDTIITSYSTGGSGGEDQLTENVSLNFAKYKVEYFKQSKTGKKEGNSDFGYDIEANKKMG